MRSIKKAYLISFTDSSWKATWSQTKEVHVVKALHKTTQGGGEEVEVEEELEAEEVEEELEVEEGNHDHLWCSMCLQNLHGCMTVTCVDLVSWSIWPENLVHVMPSPSPTCALVSRELPQPCGPHSFHFLATSYVLEASKNCAALCAMTSVWIPACFQLWMLMKMSGSMHIFSTFTGMPKVLHLLLTTEFRKQTLGNCWKISCLSLGLLHLLPTTAITGHSKMVTQWNLGKRSWCPAWLRSGRCEQGQTCTRLLRP